MEFAKRQIKIKKHGLGHTIHYTGWAKRVITPLLS